MPEYQPPEEPLTAESQRQLAHLRQSHQLRDLQKHMQQAVDKLRESAGDMNERLIDARVRYEKLKDRQRIGEDEDDDGEDLANEEYQRLAETERKVDAVTGRMEEKVRQVIDSEARLQGLTEALSNIEREESEAQAAALGNRQTRAQQRQRQRQQRRGGNDEDEEDGDNDNDEDYEGTPEREAREHNAQNPPSQRLDHALEQEAEKWNSSSLTERYVGPRFSYVYSLLSRLLITAYIGTRAIIPILAFTAPCMTPNSPAMSVLRSLMPPHGLRTWKTPARRVRAELLRVVHRLRGDTQLGIADSPRRQFQTTLPLSGNGSPSIAR